MLPSIKDVKEAVAIKIRQEMAEGEYPTSKQISDSDNTLVCLAQSYLTGEIGVLASEEEIKGIISKMRSDKCRGCENEFDRNSCFIRQIRRDERCTKGVNDEDIAHALHGKVGKGEEMSREEIENILDIWVHENGLGDYDKIPKFEEYKKLVDALVGKVAKTEGIKFPKNPYNPEYDQPKWIGYNQALKEIEGLNR